MFSVINPATEEVVTTVPSTSLEQTDEAIARSHEALKTWREVTPGDRANLLRRFSDVVRAHEDELALLEGEAEGLAEGDALGLDPERFPAAKSSMRADELRPYPHIPP
jgi:acyl-CoA reductase-like NAD-dependent aldehyde dehydrogenase